ncbi:MAG TPA: PAS domain S-box protein [Spirochaetota bacterium]|nr:PAS domain S-box protein [Spirochaetota bacterium]HQE57783.1 PAS domain S-box protein [Spirochaetota bacterium]
MKLKLTVLITAAMLSITAPEFSAGDATALPKRIIIINSYHQTFHWTDEIVTSAAAAIKNKIPDAEIYIEYMDSKRFPDYNNINAFLKRLETKYTNNAPGVIIVSDDAAFDLLKKFGGRIFPGVPIVFCGVNDIKSTENLPQNYFGIIENLDIPGNIDLIKKLFPETKYIAAITDGTPTGLGTRAEIALTEKSNPDISYIYLNGENLSTDELIYELKNLPKNSIAIAPAWYMDKTGKIYLNTESYPLIAENCPVPVISTSASNIGLGVLGGKANSGIIQGTYAAEKAVELIKFGIDASQTKVQTESRNRFIFDADAAKRFSIPISALPEDSIIINRKYSFYERYTPLVMISAAVFLLLLILIITLTKLLLSRKRVEIELKKKSEELEQYFSFALDLFCIADTKGNFLRVNNQWSQVLGYKIEELENRQFLDFVHPDDIESTLAVLSDLAEQKEVVNFVNRYKAKDGSYRHIEWKSAPRGSVIFAAARDITERIRSENEIRESHRMLRENEENLRITLNSIGDAVITTDTEGLITRINPVAEKLTGWKSQEAEGKQLSDVLKIINSRSGNEIANPAKEIISSGKIIEFTDSTLLISRDGKEYRIADSGAPIKNEDGIITGAVLVFRDMTREYSIQEQLNHSRKMDAIGRLAGGIAHDFNNMLAGIIGGAELLQMRLSEFTDDPKLNGDIDIIIKSAAHASELSNRLLAFSRRQAAASVPTDVHQAIIGAISLLQNTVDKRIVIQTEFNAESGVIMGDPPQIQNVFLNLGINASHAMPNGGILYFSTRFKNMSGDECESSPFELNPGTYIEITVSDTGCGIKPEDINKIFDPFFTTKKQGSGTGLGLAAAYATIQQHNGAITVSSKLNEGTTFKIILPLSEEPSESSSINETIYTGHGTVLLADDEEVMRLVGRGLLEKFGYNVILAENGSKAAEIYKNEKDKIDLVILDMIMPVMSGRDCFFEIKKINPEAKIIIASGFIQSRDLTELQKNGLNAFIHKPFRSHELSRVAAEMTGNLK